MSATQAHRNVKITTPLGEDVLLFHRMIGTEQLGRLFDYQLNLLSTENFIDSVDILGQNVTVEMPMQNGQPRYFNGYVTHISHHGANQRYVQYEVVLKPWLWLLTQTTDCRIFQNMSVPEILKQIFSDEGFGAYVEDALSRTYSPKEYCVQYRESDFNFVSRLMEQEGIYYYFKHQADQHTLVLCDALSAHSTVDDYATIPFYPDGSDRVEREHINQWSLSCQMQPGQFALNDFNFVKPGNNLKVERVNALGHAEDHREIYDYPGCYSEYEDGEDIVRLRMEELQVEHEVSHGAGDTVGLGCGVLFSLENTGVAQYHKEYLLTQCQYSLVADAYDTGQQPSLEEFAISFSAIDSKVSFRTARSTPTPRIEGPQTAIVVGPSGEEIYTDEHGRVKLQFHWDRYAQADEQASCWVRVSQLWAGAGWGGIHIPRIGHEVIVEFLEGDPDQPIITGRVYNGDNGVPYGLPGSATQSGIKSRSSQGGSGGNFNEIRMEDKKGEEELYFHAEKDQNIVVENCKSESVGVDESISIGNDRSEEVGNNESVTIGNDRNNTVGANETLLVGADRNRTVSGNESVSVTQMRNHTVGINELITVGGAQEIAVGGFQEIAVGGLQRTDVGLTRDVNVGGNQSVTVGGNQNVTVDGNQSMTLKANQSVDVAEDHTESIGKNMTITIGESLQIVCGKASISLKKDGTITVSGVDIAFKADGKFDAKVKKAISIDSKGNIKMKGKKILQN